MPTESDRAAARKLAAEVPAACQGGRRTWRKMTTVLDQFGYYRLTSAVRIRIAAALDEVGLEIEPPLADAERYGTIRLMPRSAWKDRPRQAGSHLETAPAPSIDVTLWRPGESPRPAGTSHGQRDGVTVFDLDLHSDPETALGLLSERCHGLDVAMLKDLLDADHLPKARTYQGDPDVRAVSSFAVFAEEAEGHERDAGASKAGHLVFQLVEFLAGSDWLITCWHRAKVYAGSEEIGEENPRGKDEILRSVAEHWASKAGLSTPGDLGIAYLHELAATYAEARREVYSWLESWEFDYYRRQDQVERETLLDVRSLMVEFRERLIALNQPGMSRKRFLVWFPGYSRYEDAEEVDELIDRSLRSLAELREQLRTSVDMVVTSNSTRQLVLAQEQQQQGERLQSSLAVVAAVLLVPTLVATIYGANTDLPGRDTWAGFEMLVLLMALSAIVTYAVLKKIQNRSPRDPDANKVARRTRDESEDPVA